MKEKRFSGKIGEDYDLFKRASSHHDEFQYNGGLELLKYFINQSKEEINVLEIGCGTGITTGIILRADRRIKLTSIDSEKVMIDQSKTKLKLFKKDRLKFILDDAFEYLQKTKEDTFDAVVSAYTIHNFERNYRELVLKEIYKKLRESGLFINADKYYFGNTTKDKRHSDWQLKRFNQFDQGNFCDAGNGPGNIFGSNLHDPRSFR